MVYRLIDARPASALSEAKGTAEESAKSPLTSSDGAKSSTKLVDGFARTISYLRLSITDRCDLRCTYCMPERMTFLPKSDILNFDELTVLVDAFIARGVRKLRITGGEPLVRRDAMKLLARFAQRLSDGGLDELTLTTNGTELKKHAHALADMGVRRINVSLDTLDRARFERLTRRDALSKVIAGLDAAIDAGLHVKINTVALADENQAEIPEIISWAHGRGHDVSLIETMPLGEDMEGRTQSYLSLEQVRANLQGYWSLTDLPDNTGGPSRYVRVEETGGRLGFITPLSHNFCATCNRIRVTATGRLYTCLGRENGADLRTALRTDPSLAAFHSLLDGAIAGKPEGHDFDAARIGTPSSARTMSVTGG